MCKQMVALNGGVDIAFAQPVCLSVHMHATILYSLHSQVWRSGVYIGYCCVLMGFSMSALCVYILF